MSQSLCLDACRTIWPSKATKLFVSAFRLRTSTQTSMQTELGLGGGMKSSVRILGTNSFWKAVHDKGGRNAAGGAESRGGGNARGLGCAACAGVVPGVRGFAVCADQGGGRADGVHQGGASGRPGRAHPGTGDALRSSARGYSVSATARLCRGPAEC